MSDKLYTQEELDAAILDALKDAELLNFEEKTKVELKAIAMRLDRANGYKETIGRDIRANGDEIREIKEMLSGTVKGMSPEQQVAALTMLNAAMARQLRRKRWLNSLPFAAAAVTVGSAVGIGLYNAIQFIFTHIR